MVKAVTWVTERRFDDFCFLLPKSTRSKMYIQRIDIFISIFIALIRSSYEKQYILYNTGTTWRHSILYRYVNTSTDGRILTENSFEC